MMQAALAPPFPTLFDTLPEPLAAAFDPEAPWALLGEPLERLLATLPSLRLDIPPPADVHLIGDRIAIGAGTRIGPGTVIEGPIVIGEGVDIRPGAYLRGGVWIGDGCVVGASTEVKHSILLAGAKAPHLNYVGDSILGAGVNLGAGTVLSNFRHDGGVISIRQEHAGGAVRRLPTGRRKLGAVLGDGVSTGCNAVLHPGVIVGAGTQIYPGVQLRNGIYPAHSLVKLGQTLTVIELRPDS